MTRPLLGLGCLFAVGCAEPPPPPAARSAAPAPTVDAGAYCKGVCERATSCGLEAMSRLARASDREQAELRAQRARAERDVEACRASCAPEAAVEASSGLVAANRCLEQTSCETFRTCLAAVSSGP